MAKILTTAIVADIRNKLNGSVFSKNRYGSYMRTKVTPVNPQTAAQQAARNRLSTASSAWRDLTEAQRQGWIDAAANFPQSDIFGNVKILSGQALYVKLNSNLSLIGATAISDAPVPVAIPALQSLTLTAAATPTLSLAYTPTPVPSDFELVIFVTPNVAPGISFVKNRFRFLTSLAGAAASPANILAAYQALNGDPVASQKIFVRAFYISSDSGQAGIPLQTMSIVAAS